MRLSPPTVVAAALVLGAAGYALLRDPPPPTGPLLAVPGTPAATPDEGDPGAQEPTDPAEEPDLAPDDEPAALLWSAPAAFKALPNPSPMRLATYGVGRAPGDAADGELSVSRAGGDVQSNVLRWTDQFEGDGGARIARRKVARMTATVVETEGTYTSAMGPAAPARPGWALLGAIVETPGEPYFFKLTGPARTVRAARAAFLGMLDGMQPVGADGG